MRAAKRLLSDLVVSGSGGTTVARVWLRRVVGSRALLLPGVGIDRSKVALSAAGGVLGDTGGLKSTVSAASLHIAG